MNLDEMLIYADINQIHKIVDNYDCQCDRHSKTDMIQAIIYKVLRKETMLHSMNQLEEVEYRFIQLLYLESRDKYTIEDLIAKGKQAINLSKSSLSPKDLVITGLRKGWYFQGVGKKNALIYLVPQDLKSKALHALKLKLEAELTVKSEISFYRDERHLFVSDLGHFLKYLINEEVLLTAEGNIYKRQQNVILQHFIVPEDPLKKVAWRFGFGRRYNEYPDRFSLLYDYSYYRGLINENEDGYLYITPIGGKWLKKLDFSKDEEDIYQFWIRLYKNSIPHLQLIVRLMDLFSFNRWVELESAKNVVNVWINDFYYETKDSIFRERIVKMLLHLGIIQLGNQDGFTYMRITAEGRRLVNYLNSFDVKELVLNK